MKKTKYQLPVPVLDIPHWRVNFKPDEYHEDLIPTLAKCFEIIQKNGSENSRPVKYGSVPIKLASSYRNSGNGAFVGQTFNWAGPG